MGDYFEAFIDDEVRALSLTRESLRDWAPTAAVDGPGDALGEQPAPPPRWLTSPRRTAPVFGLTEASTSRRSASAERSASVAAAG